MAELINSLRSGYELGEQMKNAPQRNALVGMTLDSQRQTIDKNNQLISQGKTEFDQAQAIKRAQVLSRTIDGLKSIPPQNRAAAFQQSLPQLKQFIGDFDTSQIQFDDQSLDSYKQGLQGLIYDPKTEMDKLRLGLDAQKLGMQERRLNQQASADQIRFGQQSIENDLRSQQLALSEKQEKRQSEKLSAGLEKALLTAQDDTVKAQRSASEFDILARQVSSANFEGGIVASTTETLAKFLGTPDDVTELRRKYNGVRLSEGLKNLPPGPATDRDVIEAFKGVPPENAPASQVVSFLKGAAKMARFDAGYNQFKSDFISQNSTAKGLNNEWRKSVPSSVLGRNITIAEIYAEAAAEGLTPEDVKQELGIEE